VIRKAFGPPGTGKTTWIVNQTAALVRLNEVDPYKICAVSLTKATKYALLSKLDRIGVAVNTDQIRTLHSWCYRALKESGANPYIVKTSELKEFFESKGFEFKTDEVEASEEEEFTADWHETEGNKLYQAFTKLRLTWDGVNPREHVCRFFRSEHEELSVSERTFLNLFKDYVEWLKKQGLYDFTRLLTEAYKKGVSASGDLLILDEFQDKGNLHNLIVRQWLTNFKHVLVCGDDDQAIFTFAGASPKHLIELQADETVVLPTSYRLPDKVHSLAVEVIKQNRYRVPKKFMPAKEGGKVEWLYSKDDVLSALNGKKTYILCRNRYFLQEWKEILEAEDIPYKVIGRKQNIPKIAKHIRTHLKLLGGKPVHDEELTALLNELKPLIRTVTGKKQVRETVIATVRDKIKKRNFSGVEGKIAYLILTRSPEELFTEHDESTVEKWKRRAQELEKWVSPNISIGTIHSAKGLEADTVFLDTRVTKRVLETALNDPESERRVLYVGITRTKEELYLVNPGGAYSYEHLEML